MGALNSVPFCSRGSTDDNNNRSDRADLNLATPVQLSEHLQQSVDGVVTVVDSQPEATSTPKAVRVEEKGDLAVVHGADIPNEPTPARVQTTPPPYNSMDGDSGLEHSADEVDLQEYSENNSEDSADTDQDEDLNGTLPEEIDEEQSDEKLSKPEIKDKIDFDQLEEEILGDDMVEPITDTADDDEINVDDLDIADTGKLGGKTNTTDMITDMLSQMVVDSGSRDVAIR